MIEPDPPPARAYLYHYTKAATAFDFILQSGRLRLSKIWATNDPWEARPQQSGIGRKGGAIDNLESLVKDLHSSVSLAQIGCFCSEDPDSRIRGWSHDRMWAQYADGHRGVCLQFDREKLIASFHGALAAEGQCLTDDVTYSDAEDLPLIDTDDMTQDSRAYIERYQREYAKARFFRKRVDWDREHEFRFVHLPKFSSDDHRYFPIDDALVCIIAGACFAADDEPVLSATCVRVGVAARKVSMRGPVFLNPFGPASLDSRAPSF